MPNRWSHAHFFGKEKYAVIAFQGKTERICLGVVDTYKKALNLIDKIPDYRNLRGDPIFSGAIVMTIPEKPLLPKSKYWQFEAKFNRGPPKGQPLWCPIHKTADNICNCAMPIVMAQRGVYYKPDGQATTGTLPA